VHGHGADFGLAVMDSLVLHQDRPVPLGRLLDPFSVGYPLVGGHSIMLGKGYEFPAARSESFNTAFRPRLRSMKDLVLQQHFVVMGLSSLVVADSGAVLVASAPLGPGQGRAAGGMRGG
jgi:hypothetical protein